ncbi:uncharacterized protein BDCG_06623 [Blastomyces dermatitidis ER-3]|uniref:FHA domain-containing protein n=2 Tax=Blastomyces TaxID=229219 RepID=A0A179UQU6_BLAGS|nr:uncharacterized protein BDBG_05202 [Blastomyces gilchristii SLH14081]XP_045278029.1 uncharacterized protein BDCG_06623 [Blastomyces dermatitidis ER-3]EEQ91503.1 hypothetical protein BDCG_06623 [Blastomyces dermatitidis ER-3]EQL32504.1 hypothetical protein BDFG_05371 [Blastomyces dermatitidis ATCC 26199]OAT09411.1 hypothetical protein BDBG_05202 [Blastomyces gilchristii SLH14081]
MERNKLVVTISPINFKDPIENRVLTISSEKDEIVIGRSSRVPTKDLNPARDNAFFDSRVMSRSHAVITACLQKKQVSVSDTESMHGTWLNGNKLINNEKALLGNLDVLTFGTKVTRGSETFEPLEVRLTLSWIKEVKPAPVDPPKPSKRHSVNTFVVPEDDDDEDKDFDDPQAEAIFVKRFDIEPLPHEPSVSADSDVISIHSSNNDGEQQEKSSPPSSMPSRSGEKEDDIPRSEQDVSSECSPASKPPYSSVAVAQSEVTENQVSQRPIDLASDSYNDVKTALPTLIKNDNIYDAESEDEHSQVSQEDLYPSSNTMGERLEIGTKAKYNPDSGLPQNDNTRANENTGNTTETGILNSAESFKNLHATCAMSEKLDRPSQLADTTSQPEYPRPVTTTQNFPKPGDCDDNRYRAITSSSMPEEQMNTPNPSGLDYKPSQAESSRHRDRNLALGPNRAASPSDKALARPAMGDSYYSFSEDNPSGRWIPASNKSHRPFGNPGSVGLESPAELFDGLVPSTTSDYLFPHLPPLRLPYSDGPFTASNEEDNNCLDDSDCVRDHGLAENTRDLYRFGSPFSPTRVHVPFPAAAYPNSSHQLQYAPESQPQRQHACQTAGDGSSHPPQPKYANTMPKNRKTTTSIPIANIIDGHKKVTELNPPTNPLKRKANKLNPEPMLAESFKSINDFYSGDGCDDNEDASFPDAQPRDLVISPDVTSQLSTSNSTTNSTTKIDSQDLGGPSFSSARTNESAHPPPRAKKIKVETPDVPRGAEAKTSFARYAASALLGAAVGGIGVVAALASLPPDFFN